MADYKAYVFDFDLTLADSRSGIITCFRHTLEVFGYPQPTDEAIVATIGIPLTDGFDVLTGIKMNPQREDMRKVYAKKGDEVMAANTFFYDDTVEVLEGLRRGGAKVGIVSSKMRYRIIETFDRQVKCRPYDIIIGLDDVDRPKPDPAGIELIIEKLGIKKSELLYVGDSYIDAETAMNAGVDFAGVTTGSTGKEELEKYPHVYVGGSLTEVFGNI